MKKEQFTGILERVDECCWKIPRAYKQGMRVDGLIFSSETLIEHVKKDQAADQVATSPSCRASSASPPCPTFTGIWVLHRRFAPPIPTRRCDLAGRRRL